MVTGKSRVRVEGINFQNRGVIFLFLALIIWNEQINGDSMFQRNFPPSGMTIDEDEYFINSKRDHLPKEDVTGCPREFLQRCICRTVTIQNSTNFMEPRRRDKFVVRCDESGFTNTSALQFMPIETEELIFRNNLIPILHRNMFGNKDFPNLKKIDLTNNGIQLIDGQAFDRVRNVETLILNYNELTSQIQQHPRMFSNFYNLKELHLIKAFKGISSFTDLGQVFEASNLTKLEKLHLEQNELELIANLTMFCTLPSLNQIYLGQNRLSDLNLEGTTCFQNLKFIDLRANQIRKITNESGLWNIITHLKNGRGDDIRVDLLNNPINCDCQMENFISWLKNQSVVNGDNANEKLECADGLPLSNKHLYVKEVEITECPLPPMAIANSLHTNVVIWLWFIVMFVV